MPSESGVRMSPQGHMARDKTPGRFGGQGHVVDAQGPGRVSPRVWLTKQEIGVINESLRYSARNVTEWHGLYGTPEWREQTLEPIERVREKLRRASEEEEV